MGDNALALLQYLSSDASPLPSLVTGYTRPSTVFFSNLGTFFKFSYNTARFLYLAFFALSVAFVGATYRNPAPALKKGAKSPYYGVWAANAQGIVATILSLLGALVGANGLAVIMNVTMNSGMSWFASEMSALVLYGPAALTGMSITS